MTTELSNPHDRFFKEVWSRKTIGRDFLRRYLPRDVVAMLDLKALELVKGSFVDPATACFPCLASSALCWAIWKHCYAIWRQRRSRSVKPMSAAL